MSCNLTQSDTTWSLSQIPSVKGSVLQGSPPPSTHFRRQSLVQVLWTNWLQMEVPTTLCSGTTNLLERLTGLQEASYSPDYQFITKGFNSGTARWERGLAPRDLPDPRIELTSPALAGRFFTTEHPLPGSRHHRNWG